MAVDCGEPADLLFRDGVGDGEECSDDDSTVAVVAAGHRMHRLPCRCSYEIWILEPRFINVFPRTCPGGGCRNLLLGWELGGAIEGGGDGRKEVLQ